MSNLLNLTKEESLNLLDLRKEKIVSLSLEKDVLKNHKARVALALDFSGSMRDLYQNGTVQAIIEKILPIALEFDDNGSLDVWLFDDKFRRMPEMTKDNFYGYVKSEILSKGYHMGGTNYAPVMEDIMQKYLSEEPEATPNYVIYITDGANFDKTQTNKVIREASFYPIFWQYVGIGNTEFAYLERLDDLKDRHVDNADFFSVTNIADFYEQDVIYNYLLNEYPNWLNYPKVKDMLLNNYKMETPKKKKLFGLF